MGSVAASLLKFCVSVFITAIQFTRLSMLSVRVRWKIKFGARFTWAKKNPLRNSHKLCKEIFAVTFACIVLVLGKKLSKKKKLSHSSTQTFRLENAYSCISLSLVSPKGDPKYLVYFSRYEYSACHQRFITSDEESPGSGGRLAVFPIWRLWFCSSNQSDVVYYFLVLQTT